MPLTEEERNEILAEVGQILIVEIHEQFADVYAAAVAASECHPEQANNEIRNAVAHIARALTGDDIQAARTNILKARGHIERAKRDAIKIAYLSLRSRIDDLCKMFHLRTGTLQDGFRLRKETLQRRRKAIWIAEARGEDVINHYVELYLDADQLHDDMSSEFSNTGRHLPMWRIRLIAVRRHFLGFIGGIVLTIVFAALFPDSQLLGCKIRETIGAVETDACGAEIIPPAANSPSTGG